MNHPEIPVALQRSIRCGHRHRPAGRATWNNRRQIRILHHCEAGGGNAIEGHRRGPSESLPEDLRRVAALPLILHQGNEWPASDVQAENRPEIVRATLIGHTVESSVGVLAELPLSRNVTGPVVEGVEGAAQRVVIDCSVAESAAQVVEAIEIAVSCKAPSPLCQTGANELEQPCQYQRGRSERASAA